MPDAHVAIPFPGNRPSLPTNVAPHEDLLTAYDSKSASIKQLPRAPRYLPVFGHTPYQEARWWWERMLVWKFASPVGFEALPNAHALWVVGQLCPPGEGPWEEHGHLLSLGYGVTLGHLTAPNASVAGAYMAVFPLVAPLLDAYDPEASFRLSERFPRR